MEEMELKECGTAVSAVINDTGVTPVQDSIIPFSSVSHIESSRRYLPHWQQAKATYFLTFRLADSLPKEKLDTLRNQRDAWILLNPEPWNEFQHKEHSKLFSEKLNEWLDSGSGSCILSRPEVSEIVEHSLLHFDGKRYILDEYVIMPNHVHVLLSPLDKYDLDKILHSLKSFTAHEINKKLALQGSIWMDESYDHIVRSVEQLEFYRKYIMENPSKARLSPGKYRSKKKITGGTPVPHS